MDSAAACCLCTMKQGPIFGGSMLVERHLDPELLAREPAPCGVRRLVADETFDRSRGGRGRGPGVWRPCFDAARRAWIWRWRIHQVEAMRRCVSRPSSGSSSTECG